MRRWGWLLVTACGRDEAAPPAATTPEAPTGDTSVVAPTGDTGADDTIRFDARTIDTYAGSFTAPAVTARADFDLTISWSGLAVDARGNAISPASVAEVLLLQPPTGQRVEDLVMVLQSRGPNRTDTGLWWSAAASGSYVKLTDFMAEGAPLEPSIDATDGSEWLLLLRDSDGLTLHAATLIVASDSQVTSVGLTAIPSTWAFTATAGAGADVAQGAAPPIDWSALTHDAFGEPWASGLADTLRITALAPGEPVDPLAPLDRVATASWSREVTGDDNAASGWTSSPDGAVFTGFDEGSDWLVSLHCSGCVHPTPLAAVRVRAQAR